MSISGSEYQVVQPFEDHYAKRVLLLKWEVSIDMRCSEYCFEHLVWCSSEVLTIYDATLLQGMLPLSHQIGVCLTLFIFFSKVRLVLETTRVLESIS